MVEWHCMCKRSGESIDHLLLHCEMAQDLWSALFTLFDFTWVMLERVIAISLLERSCGYSSSYSCVENNPNVLNADHMKKVKSKIL